MLSHMHCFRSSLVIASAVACLSAPAISAPEAIELITEAEAKLPPAPRLVARGGITRGPSIKVLSPEPNAQIKPPFSMNVQMHPHGGTKIDTSSIKVTYLRKPTVDLTPRLKYAISEAGIIVDAANVPAGKHDIKIDVSDTEGRTKTEVLTFTAVK